MKNKEELTKIVIAAVDEVMDLSEFPIDADFQSGLGMDSLDCVEFIMAVERDLNILIDDKVAEHLHTIEQTVEHLLTLPENEK